MLKMPIGDADSIRRQNRALVLEFLRHRGPVSRTILAEETGLSNASVSVICADMIEQGILADRPVVREAGKGRGRPSVQIGFSRNAASALLFELDVNQCRSSLIDYDGTLLDRVQYGSDQLGFASDGVSQFFIAAHAQMLKRNPDIAHNLLRISISVQGVLSHGGRRLSWSPTAELVDSNFVDVLEDELNVPVALFKRGQLLAHGTPQIYPELRGTRVATIFIGSTVGMGISGLGQFSWGHENSIGTEFGHMNHAADGALCRCGMHGCIEAYASDYGILRNSFGVPEKTPPAKSVPPSEYANLMEQARRSNREANRAFEIAGSAIGHGIGRMSAIFAPKHVIITGPGADAFDLLEPTMTAAVEESLTARVREMPDIRPHRDEYEQVFQGLSEITLGAIDQNDFAAAPTHLKR